MSHFRNSKARRNARNTRRKERPRELEARIVVRPLGDGRREVLCFCPQTNREIATGLKLWPGEVEEKVRQLKRQLERAGNYCRVVEL